MTSRERFLAAIRNQVPDQVPVAPDISNYIPVKRTGLPFWEVYFDNKVPLWQAYMDAITHFGGDAWVASVYGHSALCRYDYSDVESTHKDVYQADLDAMVRTTHIRTPDGDMTTEQLCFRRDPPTATQKHIQDLSRDFRQFRWLRRPPTGIIQEEVEKVRTYCHQRGQAYGFHVGYPGLHSWFYFVQDGLQQLSLASFDCPEILDEWYEIDLACFIQTLKLVLTAQPDYILFGGSGTLTLSSPELAMKYTIPALKILAQMCRDANVPTMLHSCGKSRMLVDMLAEHTTVNLINPLEIAPMGDVDLAEVKRARGHQIALMGNLHTTQVMLHGTPTLVRERAIQAMRDAGAGGGFILSTGDQCPRDTPDENLFALIQTAREFGAYDQATGRLKALEATKGLFQNVARASCP